MTNLKRSTTRVCICTVIAAVTAFAPPLMCGSRAWAQDSDSSDVDEMRREIRQLQAQVQALRAALNDAIDGERQNIAALNRALKGGSASTSESGAPSLKAEPPEPSRASSSSRGTPSRTASTAPVGPPTLGRRRAPVAEEAVAGVIRGHVDVPAGEPVAYVYVENIFEPAVRGRKEVIEQKEKHFNPRWAVVQRGTVIEFPNNDNIYHNVFSLSSGNSFDLGLYNSASEAKSRTFNEPGAVDIYCNIHPQMAASALVVPNRYFAKVKPDGKYEIAGVPHGKRKVVAWAPGSHLTAQWVELEGGAAAELNLKLESKSAAHKNKAGRAYGSYE